MTFLLLFETVSHQLIADVWDDDDLMVYFERLGETVKFYILPSIVDLHFVTTAASEDGVIE